MARCSESVKQQQTTVRNELTEQQIEQIKGSTHKFVNTNKSKEVRAANHANSCTRCGQTPSHGKAKCPAREAICHKCKKKGHFKALCRSTVSVNQLNANSQEQFEADSFLGAIDTVTDSSKPWIADILVNGELIQFKVDTGADVTVIPEKYYSENLYHYLTKH